jgi:hypothetical protein
MPEDIIDKVIHFISRDGESASDKDILLKQLAKEISQNKYAKFYRLRQGEADISLGQCFYNIYKTIYPLIVFMNDPAKEAKIRQITLEAFLDKHVMDIIKRLSPERIAERKKNAGTDISRELKEDLATLSAGFDSPKIVAADKCYNLIATVKQFVFFDFCSLIKKFDPEMKEGDFLSPPKFAPVDANILASEITVFLSVMPSYDADDNWKTVFEIFKYCKGGTDVIPLAHWSNLLISLKDIKQSRILELINKLATGNPILEVKPITPNENLSALWLEQKTIEVREVIYGIANSQKNSQIKTLEQAVFGSLATTRLSYYTPERERVLINKELERYTYAPALNHLLAFIQEYLTKEIQELCDILLIRGQWTNNNASRQMSEGFHNAIDITEEILHLDENLAEDGSNGPRIRAALLRVDRDKTQVRYLNSIIETINEEALSIINRAVPSLIVVGKHFKILLDDYDKKPFELIMNWKELALYSKLPISQRIAAAYKKINYFVQLMIMETQHTEE